MRVGLLVCAFFLALQGFAQSCREDDIDSVMMAMPVKGMDGIYVRQDIDVKLQRLPVEHRMAHAWKIIHYLDSTMTTMDDDARVVALYLQGVIYGDVMNLRSQAITVESKGAELAEKIGNNFMFASCVAQLINNSCRVANYDEVFRLGPLFYTLLRKVDSTVTRPYRTFDFQQKLGVTCLIAESYVDVKQLDSAMHYYSMGEGMARTVLEMNVPGSRADFWLVLAGSGKGIVYESSGLYREAISFQVSMLNLGIAYRDWRLATETALGISVLCIKAGDLNLAQHYLDTARILSSTRTPGVFERQRVTVDQADALLSGAKGNYRQAWELMKRYSGQMAEAARKHQADNVTSLLASYDYEHNHREISRLNEENQIKDERIRFQWMIFAAVAVVLVLATVIAITFIANYRRQKRINRLIETTQHQIAQSEKMASLGKLTTDLLQQIGKPVEAIQSQMEQIKKNLAVIRAIMDEQESTTSGNFPDQLSKINALKQKLKFSNTWDEVDMRVMSVKRDATGTALVISELGRSLVTSKPDER